jgi:hypothetical protein
MADTSSPRAVRPIGLQLSARLSSAPAKFTLLSSPAPGSLRVTSAAPLFDDTEGEAIGAAPAASLWLGCVSRRGARYVHVSLLRCDGVLIFRRGFGSQPLGRGAGFRRRCEPFQTSISTSQKHGDGQKICKERGHRTLDRERKLNRRSHALFQTAAGRNKDRWL